MPDKQQLLFAQKTQNTSLMETDVHFNQITDECNLITDCIQTEATAKG